MRKILIFSILACVGRCGSADAQIFRAKVGDEVYCRFDTEWKNASYGFRHASVWHFSVISGDDSSLTILCKLAAYSSDDTYSSFATDDSLKCRPSSSTDLEALSLLNRPFQYLLTKSGKTGQAGIRKVFEERIADWKLKDGWAAPMRQDADKYLFQEMRLLFLPDSNSRMEGMRMDVMRLSPKAIRSRPFDDEFIKMNIVSTHNSDLLMDGPAFDSAKVMHFFALHDPEYGNLNAYKVAKLAILGGTRMSNDHNMGHDLLLNTHDSVLAPYPVHLFNKLQILKDVSADSCYSTIRYLSKQKKMYRDWIQESFSQAFLTDRGDGLGSIAWYQRELRKEHVPEDEIAKYTKQAIRNREVAGALLPRLAGDPDPAIRDEVYPLSLWVEARNHAGNIDSVLRVAGEMKKINGHKEYGNVYRYELMVYKQLAAAGRQREANDLLDAGIGSMEQSVADSSNEVRAQEQNMLAYAYKLKSDLLQSSDSAASFDYLSKAAINSPQGPKYKAYMSFYDRCFLESEESYRSEFAERLMKQGNSKDGMRMLSQQLNTDPTMVAELQEAFTKNYPHQDFYDFFNNIVVKSWKKAASFRLTSPDGKTTHTLEEYRGKWLLIDFWGTWCGPCRQEMPQINALVQKMKDRKDFAFLSIASHDDAAAVTKYLDSKHFELPAVMSDNAVDIIYEVTGYPSKFLISPSGTVLPISFGQDWEKAVTQITALRPATKPAGAAIKKNDKGLKNKVD